MIRCYDHKFVLYWLLLFILPVFKGSAQQDTGSQTQSGHGKNNIFSVGAGIQSGFILAHSPAVENTKGANPTGLELNFSWQRNDADIWNLCNCFPRKGLLLAYYDYDTRILGRSVTAGYFLEPTYRLGKGAFLSFRGVAGLSYLSSPHDSLHNPANQSYSTALSGYLLFGLGMWFKLNDQWWMNVSINYQHESNGGLRQPNKGINWPTAGIAVSYLPDPVPYYAGARTKERFMEQSIRWDFGAFGIAKRAIDENGNSRRLPIFGVSIQGSRQVGGIHALTLGTEVFTDLALRAQLKQDSISVSHVRAGLLFGHEFLLGKFLFSQRIGMYLFDKTPYFDKLYHRWGIHYRINEHYGVGFNLQAHRHVADFIDMRFIYSWQKKGN